MRTRGHNDRTRRAILGSLTAAAIAFAACGSDDDSSSSDVTTADPDSSTGITAAEAGLGPDGCVSNFDPGADYFPDKVEPTHSTLWTAEYHGSYAVLTVPDSENPGEADLHYVLVRCGAPEPQLTGDLADAQRFTVPVKRTATNHNNAVAMLDQLDVLPTVVGLSRSILDLAGDTYMDEVLAKAGHPTAIAESVDEVDYEATLGVEADILIMAGYGPSYQNVTGALARGLPAVMVSNRIEPEPLASAEWLKFLSVFYGREKVANDRFAEIESAYYKAASAVEGKLPAGFSAAYMCIEPDNGCAFVYAHGPKSFNGKILDTLGVTNPFADGNDAPNGREFDFEDALDRAANVDFIIDYELPDAVTATLEADSRFDSFEAFKHGNYITYVPENYAFCRFNLYVQVDIAITDFAIGMAPDLFPGQTGRCFAKPAS